MSNNEKTAAVSAKTNNAAPKKFNARKMTMTAMLGAVATVLMFFEVSIPIIPSFIKLDFSELPALIGAFTMGPVSGVVICLIKNLVNLTATTTGGVGEICNFLLGACFVLPAGLIYKKKKTRKRAVIGALTGSAIMAVLSLPINYFIVYPVYTAFMPMETIIGMYQVILPSVDSLIKALMIFNMPFTFFKGLCSVGITLVIYKYISPLIKGNTIA